MPEKMGNTLDKEIYKGPLTVGRPTNEPGPDVNNSPVGRPDDPLGFLPENSKTMGGSRSRR